MSAPKRGYQSNVFINCPFDDKYKPIFEAIVFAVFDCGFRPLCARERMNSGQVRMEKILDQIRDSQYSIHDLSRTELDDRYSLPRFNMPLELGIALGCAKFGAGKQRRKSVLIMDRRRYRYHRFISDIAGQDISEHRDRPATAIEMVRNWLRAESQLTSTGSSTSSAVIGASSASCRAPRPLSNSTRSVSPTSITAT